MALTKVVWELVKRPEYIEPLRAEMHDVFGSGVGTADICINKEALSRLHKLDSFIREVQRWCPSTFGKSKTHKVVNARGTNRMAQSLQADAS